MSIKSALFAVVATLVLMLAFGNEWMLERAFEGGFAEQTRGNVSSQLQFALWEDRFEGDRGAMTIHLLVLIVLAGVLGGIVGRARPLAAFVGGWGAFLAASVVSMGVYELVRDERFGPTGQDAVDRFTASSGFGVSVGMWLGWLVGLAVMLGSLGTVAARTDSTRPAAAPWPPPPPNPAGAFDPTPAPHHPGGFDPPAPSAPVIGPPPDPDRTQVFGEPPARDT